MAIPFFRSSTRSLNAENPAIGEFIDFAGRKLHYVSEGPTDAPALVLLHGASGNLRDWTSSVFDDLAKSWRVIAFDRPGYGHSDLLPEKSWLIQPQTRVLNAAMTRLGHRKYAVLGHSYGVAVALDWALQFPDHVSGIVAMSGAMTSWAGALGWRYRWGGVSPIGALMGAIVPLVASQKVLETELAEVFAPQAMPASYIENGGVRLALRPRTFALNLRAMDTLHSQTMEIMSAIPDVLCPTEVLHGGADEIIPFDPEAGPVASLARFSHTVVLQGIGHMPHHVAGPEVLAAVDRLRARL